MSGISSFALSLFFFLVPRVSQSVYHSAKQLLGLTMHWARYEVMKVQWETIKLHTVKELLAGCV